MGDGTPSHAATPRSRRVAALFDRNAARYDLANTIICFGQDALWRRWVAAEALGHGRSKPWSETGTPPPAGQARVLDACGGTGLVALELARRGARVTLADVSEGMLAVARSRVDARRLPIQVVAADLTADAAAAALPGAPYDAVTLAFGLRYVDDPAGLLRGLAAALRPGGVLVALEAVTPPPAPASRLAGVYFFHVAPLMASLVAGRAELYGELTRTVRAFGGPARLPELLAEAGLAPGPPVSFARGIVTGVVARRPSG
jgi:demethylmenaquinone methyltransferase/2-methoxy-6-polyprenyl-1,4-benzoquinol methylase